MNSFLNGFGIKNNVMSYVEPIAHVGTFVDITTGNAVDAFIYENEEYLYAEVIALEDKWYFAPYDKSKRIMCYSERTKELRYLEFPADLKAFDNTFRWATVSHQYIYFLPWNSRYILAMDKNTEQLRCVPTPNVDNVRVTSYCHWRQYIIMTKLDKQELLLFDTMSERTRNVALPMLEQSVFDIKCMPEGDLFVSSEKSSKICRFQLCNELDNLIQQEPIDIIKIADSSEGLSFRLREMNQYLIAISTTGGIMFRYNVKTGDSNTVILDDEIIKHETIREIKCWKDCLGVVALFNNAEIYGILNCEEMSIEWHKLPSTRFERGKMECMFFEDERGNLNDYIDYLDAMLS